MPRILVQRSVEIRADVGEVYQRVADYGTWTAWSPWLLAEPEAEVFVDGPPGTVGSVYRWEGDVVGAGEIEHLELTPNKEIRDEIRFLKPWKSVSAVRFLFEPVENGCRVTWEMDSRLPWFMFPMSSMFRTFIGMDYARGLGMLKEWVETGSILSRVEVIGRELTGPLYLVGVRRRCPVDEIGSSMKSAFADAEQQVRAAGLPVTDNCASVYHKLDMRRGEFDYTSGFLLDAEISSPPNDLSYWLLPTEVPAFRVTHHGPYRFLGNGWSVANQIVRYRKLKQSRVGSWEIYRNDPGETPESEIQTDIYLPLKK